jgi:hypothetical protein
MSQRMMHLPPDIVAHMRENCPARTDAALQPRFGISYNTWRRIEQGAALRRSLAQRILDRVQAERTPR